MAPAGRVEAAVGGGAGVRNVETFDHGPNAPLITALARHRYSAAWARAQPTA
ncbi:MAG: hypothetical protein ABGY72_09160 [bacterium]